MFVSALAVSVGCVNVGFRAYTRASRKMGIALGGIALHDVATLAAAIAMPSR